ncbi:MAG TPA: PrsW family glutamic-type intramembrane protease [Erysipelotrichaceae bacterium]|nr:PrsW family glutamic-type intramembrane protease [Erysipelotrichaceae bacterium]HQB32896.1 PrsW family glutamic-type intramembrane protease [Erysipelotrichaceae bacterium]
MNQQILTIVAVVPGLVYAVYLYIRDRHEKEPLWLLALLLFGGLLATVASFFLEQFADGFLSAFFTYKDTVYYLIQAFIGVALIEEGTKYLFLNLFSWRSKHFNCLYDGLIYSVFVSLGFAISENILYAYSYGLNTAIVRAFTAVPAHVCFGVVMGAYYAKAKVVANQGKVVSAKAYRTTGLLLAVILHGFYDYFLFDVTKDYFYIWVGLVVAIYIIIFATVRATSKKDRYITDQQ